MVDTDVPLCCTDVHTNVHASSTHVIRHHYSLTDPPGFRALVMHIMQHYSVMVDTYQHILLTGVTSVQFTQKSTF